MALTPNVGGAPSAAKARELIMSGRVAEGMQMLKAASGQADTSIKSNDALQYMQKTGDQQGTNALLQASVGLPPNTQPTNYAQQVGTMPTMTQMTQKEAMDKLASGQAQYSTVTPSPQLQQAMSQYQQQMQQMAAQQQTQQQQMPYQQAQQIPYQQQPQQMPQTFAQQIMAGTTSQQVDPNSATAQAFLGAAPQTMPTNAPSYAEQMAAQQQTQQQTQQPQPTQHQITPRPGYLTPPTQQQQTPSISNLLGKLQSKYQQQFQPTQQQQTNYNDIGVPGGAASFYGTPQPQPTQMAQPLGGTFGGMSEPQTTSAMSQPTQTMPGLSLMEIFQQHGAMRNNLLNSASGGLF